MSEDDLDTALKKLYFLTERFSRHVAQIELFTDKIDRLERMGSRVEEVLAEFRKDFAHYSDVARSERIMLLQNFGIDNVKREGGVEVSGGQVTVGQDLSGGNTSPRE